LRRHRKIGPRRIGLGHIGLGGLLFVLAACSPACTPPDAKSPDDEGTTPQSRSPSADASSERDEKRAALPQGEMIMEAKGVDTSKLSETQRTTFFQIINTEPSACDKPHSIAKSLQDDAECRDSLIVAQFVSDALAAGLTTSVVKAEIEGVVDSLQPRELTTEGRPLYGSERAPVTVVMFADFECPHCRAEAPVLRQTIDQFRGRARLVFKHFPLSGHERAKPAAVACEAAHAQGKFWKMADVVFANQTELSDTDILAYAQQAGLDMDRFKADMKKAEMAASVDRDRSEGVDAGVEGTPAVFVNGRFVNDRLFGGSVAGWIDDALKR
jgi:protein-disulfide isomerase